MPEEESVTLTRGSRYRIVSIETREKSMISHGVFRGYGTIGPDEAITLELDESHKDQKGKLRLIPCHMVLAVDIVEQVREEKEKQERPERMYG